MCIGYCKCVYDIVNVCVCARVCVRAHAQAEDRKCCMVYTKHHGLGDLQLRYVGSQHHYGNSLFACQAPRGETERERHSVCACVRANVCRGTERTECR